MNKHWLTCILIISMFLLSVLKAKEVNSLQIFFKAYPSIKLKRFQAAKESRSLADQELLELWESILTGRSAPVAAWMKERYKVLGLNHIFSPSGFHLSAILLPFMKFIKNTKLQVVTIACVGIFLCFLPGLAALKRMVVIKAAQRISGRKSGFIVALFLDILMGSFQTSAISFTYSFLFLGIIYSGLKGLGLIIWFFVAQILLVYFQGQLISPGLLIISPLLNFGFGLAMPALFLLALPLYEWQVDAGLILLRSLQYCVDQSAWFISLFPSWEIHAGFLVIIVLVLYKKWMLVSFTLLFMSSSLTLDLAKQPAGSAYDYIPQGKVIRKITNLKEEVIYFSDGKCKLRLVRGYWWENCSPRTRSRKKSMKLSYPS